MDDAIMKEIIIENERLRTEALQRQSSAIVEAVGKMAEVYAAERERETAPSQPDAKSELKKIREECWFVGHMVKIGYQSAPGGFSPDHEMTRQWARWLRLLERHRKLSEAELGL